MLMMHTVWLTRRGIRNSESIASLSLRIKLRKFTPMSGVSYEDPTIPVKNTSREVIDTLPYLGCIIAKDGALDAQVFSLI